MKNVKINQILDTIPFVIAVCVICLPGYARYSGGTGEPNDPYQIATAADLILLGESWEDYGKHFILTADIDLDPNLPGRRVFDQALIGYRPYGGRLRGSEVEWRPTFSGTFDGAGHIIKNLSISGEDTIGLFGATSGSVVRGLGLVNAKVEGTHDVGILAGIGGGHVYSCFTTGCVVGEKNIGGLVGKVTGTVTDCYSHASVNGTDYVGGLVGANEGDMACCYSTGQVNGMEHLGGLVGGRLYGLGATPYCIWDIETSGQKDSAQGVGFETAQMQDAQLYLDMGWDFRDERQDGLHESWQWKETGDYPVLSIFHGFSPPVLTGKGNKIEPYLISTVEELGAALYYNLFAFYRLTNDLDMNGILWTKAVIPSFRGHFDGAGHVIQGLKIRGGGEVGLFGTLSGATLVDIGVVDAYVWGAGDEIGILAGSNTSSHLLDCHTTGFVHGKDHVGGLVGRDHGGVNRIKRSYSRTVVVAQDVVGGLVGGSYGGTITQCYSHSIVTGMAFVGGLIGEVQWNSEVNNCYSAGTLYGDIFIGGFVGQNMGRINHSYSVCLMNGFEWLGGFAGTGLDQQIVQCFWDITSSGQPESIGGIGLTTFEALDTVTYLSAGWDFINEGQNGVEDIWWIDEGQDYPRFRWEIDTEH